MNNYYREPYNAGYVPDQSILNKNTINVPNQIRDTEGFINANVGKKVRIFMSFPDSIEWRDKIFEGTIQSVGIDYILIKDNENMPVLLQKIYINFIEFDEAVNY